MPTHPIHGNPLATFTPMVGVSIGLPITIGGFDPLTIDPVFYVDASTSMLGVLEAPPLDLNPAVPSSLDIITATRAGVATYTDASGTIQNAPENTVRVDHVDGVPMMLIEPAATNLVTNTDFSGWTQASSTTLTDGSGYAGQPSKIFEATSGTHRTFHTPTFATTAGTTYTGSIWIRRVSGTGTIQLNHQYSAQGNLTTITDDISEEWTRVEVNFTGHASSGDMWFGIWINEQGDSVEIAMPQVEEGTVATSFIPTAGSAVTRNADNLVIDGTDFTDFYNTDEGTFYVESVLQGDTTTQYVFDVNNGSQQRNILYYSGALRNLIRKDNTTTAGQSLGTKPSVDTLSRAAYSYATDNFKGSIDGESVKTDTSVTPPTTVNNVTIGSYFTYTNHLNGHIKRLIYWPLHSDSL